MAKVNKSALMGAGTMLFEEKNQPFSKKKLKMADFFGRDRLVGARLSVY